MIVIRRKNPFYPHSLNLFNVGVDRFSSVWVLLQYITKKGISATIDRAFSFHAKGPLPFVSTIQQKPARGPDSQTPEERIPTLVGMTQDSRGIYALPRTAANGESAR
jgi:hypothetical protein